MCEVISNYKIALLERYRAGDFESRTKQMPFVALMRELIIEVVKNPFNENTLSALIEISKHNTSDECIKKYIPKLNITNSEYFISKMIAIDRNYRGLTSKGRQVRANAVGGMEGLEKVRNFLRRIIDAPSLEKVIFSIEQFDKLNIPIVKYGIYSPLLAYLRPRDCPILNRGAAPLYRKLGWMEDTYSSLVSFVHNNLQACIIEDSLLYIDASSWKGIQEQIFPDDLFPATDSWDMETSICEFWKDVNARTSLKISEFHDWVVGSVTCFFAPIEFCGFKKMTWSRFLQKKESAEGLPVITRGNITGERSYGLEQISRGPIHAAWQEWLKSCGVNDVETKALFGSDGDIDETTIESDIPLSRVLQLIRPHQDDSLHGERERQKALILRSFMKTIPDSNDWKSDDGDAECDFYEIVDAYSENAARSGVSAKDYLDLLKFLMDLELGNILDENEKSLPIKSLQDCDEDSLRKCKFRFTKPLSLPFELPACHFELENAIGAKVKGNQKMKKEGESIHLNTILFGPPGTGKTFSTIDLALEILDPKYLAENPEDLTQNWKIQQDRRQKLKKRLEELKDRICFVTFHQSFCYEDFVEGLRAETTEEHQIRYDIKDGIFKILCDAARMSSNEPHVLVIDEINRGNISRILGELITLIEPSKRSGADEALEVTLPYSKKPFSIPPNVYLIGTMNTADRSLAVLDIALRRRFEFKEMPPQPELLEDINIELLNIGKMLRAINKRIEVLLDRDHCLGHTYFLPLKRNGNLDTLSFIFRRQIMPLLQEYFFEDWKRISWVLNENHNKPRAQRFLLESESDLGKIFDAEILESLQTIERRWNINECAFNNIESYLGILGD